MKSRDLRKSQAQERRGARNFGGQVRPASGALPSFKGDVKSDTDLVEFKRTDKKQITIKDEYLEKIALEALVEGRTAVLGFEMASGRRWVMVQEPDWLERGSAVGGSSGVDES